MKAGLWLSLGAALVLAIPPTVGATVDKNVFKCEATDAKEISKFAGGRAKCISKCVTAKFKGDTTVDCTGDGNGGGFDTATQACVDATLTKYKSKVGAKCAGFLPPCGGYAPYSPNDVDGYTDQNASDQIGLIDPVVEPVLFCDLSSKDALKCEQGVVKNLTKYTDAIIKCLTKCRTRQQLKGENINCDPTQMCPTEQLDPTTWGCILAAKGKTKAGILKKCASFPNCGVYVGGIDALLGLVEGNIFPNYADGSGSNPFCASPSGAFLDPASSLF